MGGGVHVLYDISLMTNVHDGTANPLTSSSINIDQFIETSVSGNSRPRSFKGFVKIQFS